MKPLTTHDDVLAALPGSLLLRQIAAKRAPGYAAYARGGAVGLYHAFGPEPDLVVIGDPDDAAELAREIRAAHPDLGGGAFSVPAAAGARLVAEDGLVRVDGWAFRWTGVPPPLAVTGAEWLTAGDEPEVKDLLARGFPDASMPVGHPGVLRWAGLRRDGRLVAAAADTTLLPDLGFLASITSDPDARGTGAGAAITAWATARLIEQHGACGLWHMSANVVAAALYTRLGFHDDDPMWVVAPA